MPQMASIGIWPALKRQNMVHVAGLRAYTHQDHKNPKPAWLLQALLARLAFSLRHGGARVTSDCLTWAPWWNQFDLWFRAELRGFCVHFVLPSLEPRDS